MSLAQYPLSSPNNHQSGTPDYSVDNTKPKMAAHHLTQDEFHRQLNEHKQSLDQEYKRMKTELREHHDLQYASDKRNLQQKLDSQLE